MLVQNAIDKFLMPLSEAHRLFKFINEDNFMLTEGMIKTRFRELVTTNHPDKNPNETEFDASALNEAKDVLIHYYTIYLPAMRALLQVFTDPDFNNLNDLFLKISIHEERLSKLNKEYPDRNTVRIIDAENLKAKLLEPHELDKLSARQKLSNEEFAILHLLDHYSLTKKSGDQSISYLRENRQHSIQLINDLGLADFVCDQIRKIVIAFKNDPSPENGEICQRQLEFIFTNLCPKDLELKDSDVEKNQNAQEKVRKKNDILLDKIKIATAELESEQDNITRFKQLVNHLYQIMDGQLIGPQAVITAAHQLELTHDENTNLLIAEIKKIVEEHASNDVLLAELNKNSTQLNEAKPLAKTYQGLMKPLQEHAKELEKPKDTESDKHKKSLQLTESITVIRQGLENTMQAEIVKAKELPDFSHISHHISKTQKNSKKSEIASQDLHHKSHQFAAAVYLTAIEQAKKQENEKDIAGYRNLAGPIIKGIVGSFLTFITVGSLLLSQHFRGYFFNSRTGAILHKGTAELQQKEEEASALVSRGLTKGCRSAG